MNSATVFYILSKHIFVGQQAVTNLLPDDKSFVGQFFFSFVAEFFSFKLIFSSEKRSPVEYLARVE